MIDALQISQSGLRATQQWIDLISNNVSNSQTVGYKKSSIQFIELIGGQSESLSAVNNQQFGRGLGTRVGSISPVFTLGSVQLTERPLDLAINGNGFFELVLEDGTLAYSKVGRFVVDEDGRLGLQSGALLSDDILVPSDTTQLSISENGVVEALVEGEVEPLQLGEIQLANIVNVSDMQAIGNGLYQIRNAESDVVLYRPGEGGVGALMQGYLELSNVNLIEEMTNLVLAQRTYQLNARMIQVADSILETANNIRR